MDLTESFVRNFANTLPCWSVLQMIKLTPVIPCLYIKLTALLPPPPTPITLMIDSSLVVYRKHIIACCLCHWNLVTCHHLSIVWIFLPALLKMSVILSDFTLVWTLLVVQEPYRETFSKKHRFSVRIASVFSTFLLIIHMFLTCWISVPREISLSNPL